MAESDMIEEDADGAPLVVGSFYWAQPVRDCDTDADHWSQFMQPARFVSYTGDGEARWEWIGLADDEWPACRIGRKVTPDAE
jgi:hypothetical protein